MGAWSAPVTVNDDKVHASQFLPRLAVDQTTGNVAISWYDTRNDASYSPARPIGNSADRDASHPSLDVFGARSTNRGATWTGKTRITDMTTNGNWEQFANRTIPFAGDYLWVSSVGNTAFVTWTDWRNTVAGADPRERTAEDNDAADVVQAIFITLLPIVIRIGMESFGSVFFNPQTVLNLIPNLRLMVFGALIIFFLVVEPDGLNRLWRNIRNYFRIWPFAY